MTLTEARMTRDLNAVFSRAVSAFRPPEALTVDEWADKYRRLSPESSAEAGPWRTSRTPYLREPMKAFTDPKVRKVVIVAGSQIGKTECELNCLAYLMDQDPGTVIFVHPTIEDARKFSRLRIEPMIRDCKRLKRKVIDRPSGREQSKTILQKSFPGGMLILCGSNAPSALASTPARYIFGDERDRWAHSAGDEGDPWMLAEARQTTFYNAKAIEVSTPTVKGASAISASFEQGTQERWKTQCPHCGKWHEIGFDELRFPHLPVVEWACPSCGVLSTEDEMRAQPSRWVADHPEALDDSGVRSFWLNAFCSPWTSWNKIVTRFLNAKDDPQQLQVVYNTLFGRLWEDRGDLPEEDALLARREDYGYTDEGIPVEVPDGVMVLTCGFDTQDDRLEYEVVGHGRWQETWGIKKGIIYGRPDDDATWERFDGVVTKLYKYRNGQGLRISLTLIDANGHYTQEIYKRTRVRARVFACMGKGGEGVPYTKPPTRQQIKGKRMTAWLYMLGVDAGKEQIMANLKKQEPGNHFCHFPRERSAGYDEVFFNGLLSERKVRSESRTASKMQWERIPGHPHNEPLDCRNYAMAALELLDPDWDLLEAQRKGIETKKPKRTRHKRRSKADEAW